MKSVETLTSVKMDFLWRPPWRATSVNGETAIIHLVTNIRATVQILCVMFTVMDGVVPV